MENVTGASSENVTGASSERAMHMHVRSDRDIAQNASKAIPLPAGSIQGNTTFKEGIRVSQKKGAGKAYGLTSLTSKPQSPLSGAEKAVPPSRPHSEPLENATPPGSPLKKELGELQDKIEAFGEVQDKIEALDKQIKDGIQKAEKEYAKAIRIREAAQDKRSLALRSYNEALGSLKENEKLMKFMGKKMKIDIVGYLKKWKPETLNEIGAKEYMEMDDAAFQATINDLKRLNRAIDAMKKVGAEAILESQAIDNALDVRQQEMDRVASLKEEQEALRRLRLELQSEFE